MSHREPRSPRMETPPPGLGSNRVPVDKSPVLAFLLTLFLGSLGLLYVKVVPALLLDTGGTHGLFHLRCHHCGGMDRLDRLGLCRGLPPAPRLAAVVGFHGNQAVAVPGYRQEAALAYHLGQDAPLPPAGWYTDTADPTRVRWWDGSEWTADTPAADQPPPRG